MNEELRKSGIEAVGDIPWGTHFCQFYRTRQDLLEILVPYFSEGLKNNEFCIWVASEPLDIRTVRAGLAAVLPDFEDRVRRRQIEIIPHADVYLKEGAFDADRILGGLERKLEGALAAGFEGLRMAGDGSWLETKDWPAFTDYEAAVDKVLARSKALAACAYSLDRCGFNEILDVVRNHRFALARREGRWELVESGERRRLQEDLEKHSLELEKARELLGEEARLDALLKLSQMGDLPINEISSFALERAVALTGSGIGFIGFLSEDESIYTLHSVSRNVVKECAVTGEPLQWHVADAGIWADAIRERRTLFLNDYSLPHPRKKGLPDGHPYVQRFMVVPLLEGGRIISLAGVGNKASDYNASDERQVSLLLSGMWSCVRRKRSAEDLETANRELDEKVRLRTVELTEANAELRKEVAERRMAQLELRRSEGLLKRAQEMAQLGSWELDVVRNRLTWSGEVFRIFGLSSQGFHATYEAFLEVVHPEDRGSVAAAYAASLRDGLDSFELEFRIVRRDTGEVRNVFARCEHRRDASGRVDRSVGMIHDITERKKTEALRLALTEQERLRLGAAVEQASESIVMLDLDGTIRYVNAAFEVINKLSRSTVSGRTYYELIGDSPAGTEIRQAVVAGRAWHGQLDRQAPDGRMVELEVTLSPAMDPSGAIIGGLVTEKDVTEEKSLQLQVRQAQKMEALGTLAGGITHDFNNILGAIIVNTELALLDLDPNHPARAALPMVLRAAARGKELVKQIIAFSRQREWERKPLEVAPIVLEAVRFLRATLPKNIEVRESISTGGGAVLGDPSQIHQVIVNLCQNAALAMPEGGEVSVGLEAVEIDSPASRGLPDLKPGPHLCLTVGDTGCGMSQELVERIFEPFFTTRNPGSGSGLGLAVVHGIVRGYDGAITVASEPGKGSLFSVYLPRLEGKGPEPEAVRPTIPVGGRERVLLVEDEEAQRDSLARGLKRLGYQVTARASGRSALSIFRKEPDGFDVVITDQTMPEMTGLALASELRRVKPGVPVILCTGFSEQVNDGAVARSGVRDFIMKPFTLEEISRAISKVRGKGR